MTHLLGSFEPLFDRHANIDAEFFGHSLSFLHDGRSQRARFGALNDIDQRRASQRADRIVSNVAHQLDPDVVSNVSANRTSQTGFDQRVGDAATSFTLGSVRLADSKPISFRVPHDARLENFSRWINSAANDA